jgi:NarL family two-component system sensor histidine kinase LiaS
LLEETNTTFNSLRPSKVGAIAIYLAFAAIVMQILVRVTKDETLYWYIGLLIAYLLLYTLALWRTESPGSFTHLYLVLQSIIILTLLSFDPNIDVVNGLFALLSYQVATLFTGRIRWLWLLVLISLTLGSLMYFLGAIQGVAQGLTPTAGGIALAFVVIANQEIKIARAESRVLIAKLEKSRQQLQIYADQVEDLATIEERNRLARELHDAISQTMFSITLTTRSSQMLVEQDPGKAKPLLEELQTLTNTALADMRSLIVKLRPPVNETS